MSLLDNLKSSLVEVFGENSEEFSVIVDSYIMVSRMPSTASEAKVRMMILDQTRVKLSTIYYMLCREIARLQGAVQSTYDSQYTRLVKLGRPTKDAIESEIRSSNPEYSGIQKKVSAYEDVKGLITMYLRCIDSEKNTATEFLRNINRID